MSDTIIGALTAPSHDERRAACEETWIPLVEAAGVDFVWLIGRPDLAKAERDGRMLYLPCDEGYPQLPQKTREFCKWAVTQAGDAWQYLFKTDDDVYLHAHRFAVYEPAGRDYIGAEWKPRVRYASGAGYWISRKAAHIVASNLRDRTGAEDQLVGRLLHEAGMVLHLEPRICPGIMERTPVTADNDMILTHKITPQVVRQMHERQS